MEVLIVLRRKCSSKKLKLSRSSYSSSSRHASKSESCKEKKAEQISKPKRLDRYVAVAEYEVQAPGEMLLFPGLRVDVLEKSDSGWWFVNSEDEQGWVPSTYLEPESEESASMVPAAIAEPGQEENFICIEKFEGASADEVSLEKGAVVQVLQKNMDGWWLVRYQGREAYAPGTYLKKATTGQSHALVEKSRLSGVQIISSLQDVSTLLNQDKKNDSPLAATENSVRNNNRASAVVKTKSLERGGSLIPPPRQNSITAPHTNSETVTTHVDTSIVESDENTEDSHDLPQDTPVDPAFEEHTTTPSPNHKQAVCEYTTQVTPKQTKPTLVDCASSPIFKQDSTPKQFPDTQIPLTDKEERQHTNFVKRKLAQSKNKVITYKTGGQPISFMKITNYRKPSASASTSTKRQRSQQIETAREIVAGTSKPSLHTQQTHELNRLSKLVRREVFKDTGLESTVHIDEQKSLAMKVNVGLTYSQQREIKRVLKGCGVTVAHEGAERKGSNFQTQVSTASQGDDFSDEDWYDHPDMSDEPEPVREGENSKGYMDMAKRPLPPIPPGDDPGYEQPSPVSQSPRLAHRPLPAAPGPVPTKSGLVPPTPKKPAGLAKTNSNTSSQDAAPKAALLGGGGGNQDFAAMLKAKSSALKAKEPVSSQDAAPKAALPNTGRGDQDFVAVLKAKSSALKAKEPVSSQDAAPKAALPNTGGGDQDFAAMLKAKFAARSGAAVDSGNSSEEDSGKPSKLMPVTPKVQPVMPKKPSEFKRDPEESSKGFGLPAKPAPPVKNKAAKPPGLPAKPGGPSSGPQPNFPAVQLKPVNKPDATEASDSKNPIRVVNGPFVPLKSTGTALGSTGISKPKPPADKPLLPGKLKPAPAAKPMVSSKPFVTAQKPGTNVCSLANNLGGKLNFGKAEVDSPPTEAAAKPAVLPKKPSSQSGAPDAPMKRSYVALFDFTAENDGEISFNEGDDLEMLDEQGDWSYVRIWDEEGWAPTAYLEKL
ncbi:SH3 and PX domain-containing protein 2B [Elysia marginata]|uniref:SH3 and PX domain-containing protein 2B n=1 Tax=Elysia marginata TaxID=1093978 RepID=A0AAV4FW64_9GAST|nr:SH3 and PX domain-containing protein 2B [Elysia marginata]